MVLALTVVYGALLRANALIVSFGPYERPAWLAAVQPIVTSVHGVVGPRWQWAHVDDPYAGGDPHTYLEFAREMRHFYQAHVREPVFLAATRAGLAISGGADVGISLASIAFSLLLIVAAYLVGAELVSRPAGLVAAVAMAIDRDVIEWSIGGWRDGAFAATALLSVWLWLRLGRQPTRRAALWAGVATGVACLTRLTAPFMIAPAMLWVVIAASPAQRRSLLQPIVSALAVATVIVAPYLIACALAFGDPLYAINYHTQFYLERSGRAAEIISASRYVVEEWQAGPVKALDTALAGVTTYPFFNKWGGLDAWVRGLGTVAMTLSAIGLLICAWTPRWRVLVVVLVGSLLPYMMTWPIPGGSEWRFTLHVYPLYLIAAAAGGMTIAAWGRALRHDRVTALRRLRRLAMWTTAAAIAAAAWIVVAPYLMAREALRHGRPAVIGAGRRDWLLLTEGWSGLSRAGNVIARFNTAPWSRLRIPLPERRDYALELRLDPIPVGDEPAQRVHVALNGRPVATLPLTWNPDVVGRYAVRLPAAWVTPGANELTLQPEQTLAGRDVVSRYPDVDADARLGFRFWYVMITAK